MAKKIQQNSNKNGMSIPETRPRQEQKTILGLLLDTKSP